VYTYLRSCVLFRRLLVKYGPDKVKAKFRNRVRHAFTFVGSQLDLRYSEYSEMVPIRQAYKALKAFFADLSWWVMGEKILQGTRYFNRLISFMQRRMKAKL